jgi:hypothetical protein
VHSIAASLFASKDQVHFFNDIGYVYQQLVPKFISDLEVLTFFFEKDIVIHHSSIVHREATYGERASARVTLRIRLVCRSLYPYIQFSI